MKRPRREFTPQEKAERALISVMADWPLKPGQMLFLGPKSVAALMDERGYDPRQLVDKFIIEKSEWHNPSPPPESNRSSRAQSRRPAP
jgi:hypothetical protein